MEERIATLEKENKELKERLALLERKIETFAQTNTSKQNIPSNIPSNTLKLLGFRITKELQYVYTKGVKKIYHPYYAIKVQKGKKVRIYIGSELPTNEEIEKKIQAYCTKKGITTEVSTAGNLENK